MLSTFLDQSTKKITSSQRENEEVFLHAEKEAILCQRQAASKVHFKAKTLIFSLSTFL